MDKTCSIVQDLLPLYEEDMLREEMPWLYVRYAENICGIQKNLTGLDLDPEWYCEYRFVTSK